MRITRSRLRRIIREEAAKMRGGRSRLTESEDKVRQMARRGASASPMESVAYSFLDAGLEQVPEWDGRGWTIPASVTASGLGKISFWDNAGTIMADIGPGDFAFTMRGQSLADVLNVLIP